jgi:ArsR family transcriptional regulator, arsenate/arsenite/antimonite-responsive transcriptional repressor
MDAVMIFKALSDPNRLRIMKMLEHRELCVCEIRSVLELSNSTVSEHLTVLRDVGLILDRKDGKWVNYRLNDQCCVNLIKAVLELLEEYVGKESMLKQDAIKVKKADRTKLCCTIS